MKRFFSVLMVLVSALAISSCSSTYSGGYNYYVNYKAIPINEVELSVEHPIIVTMPMTMTEEKSHLLYQYDKVFGPFKAGQEVIIMADLPNRNTYKVQIWVRKGDIGMFQLYEEGVNVAQAIIPVL